MVLKLYRGRIIFSVCLFAAFGLGFVLHSLLAPSAGPLSATPDPMMNLAEVENNLPHSEWELESSQEPTDKEIIIAIDYYPPQGESDVEQYYVEGTLSFFDSQTMYLFVLVENHEGKKFVKPSDDFPVSTVHLDEDTGALSFRTRVHSDDYDRDVAFYTVLVVPKQAVPNLNDLNIADLMACAIAEKSWKR